MSHVLFDAAKLEREHPEGLSLQQVLAFVGETGDRLTEATFRKYVQLGLLPRSVRVGRKGKHKGSQGLYPPSVVGQVVHVRKLMAQGFTIEQIQQEFMLLGPDIEALGRQVQKTLRIVEAALKERGVLDDPLLNRAVQEIRGLGEEMVQKLRALEKRLSMGARMARAAV